MFYKVKEVKPLQNYSLMVQFEDNTKKIYDLNPLFSRWEAFEAILQTTGLFEQVRVDVGGYGISWNDDIDISCNELYNNGKTIS